jgi:hypothetical protein
MNSGIVEAKLEATQRELQGRATELQNVSKRVDELQLVIHNLKVQIATYEDLLKDDQPTAATEVRETIESLVAE